MTGHSAIYKLHKAECEKLCAAFSISTDVKTYTESIPGIEKKNALDQLREMIKYNLGAHPIIVEEITKQIESQIASRTEENPITWNTERLQAALQLTKKQRELAEKAEASKMNEAAGGQNEPGKTTGGVTANTDHYKKYRPPTPPRGHTAGKQLTEESLAMLINKMSFDKEKDIGMPEFNGTEEEDIVDHLETFEKIATINRWGNEAKIKKYSKLLKNLAHRYYMKEIVQVDRPMEWSDVKEKLLDRFRKTEIEWDYLLSQMAQKEDEDPEIYAIKVEELCRKINPAMEQETICLKIMKGLQPSLREELLHRNIETVNELRKNIKRIRMNSKQFSDGHTAILNALRTLTEKIETKEGTGAKEESSTNNQKGQGNQNRAKQRGRGGRRGRNGGGRRGGRNQNYNPNYGRNNYSNYNQNGYQDYNQGGNQNYTPNSNRGFLKGVNCNFCGIEGHKAKECRKRLGITCNACGKQGHYANECWGNTGNPYKQQYNSQGRGGIASQVPQITYPPQDSAIQKNE